MVGVGEITAVLGFLIDISNHDIAWHFGIKRKVWNYMIIRIYIIKPILVNYTYYFYTIFFLFISKRGHIFISF